MERQRDREGEKEGEEKRGEGREGREGREGKTHRSWDKESATLSDSIRTH